MRLARWCRCLGAIVLLAGACDSSDKPVPLQGIVKLDDAPVEGAMVTFHPEDTTGRHAHGRTGPDGTFRLTTHKPGDGAYRGSYKVTIQYVEGQEMPAADSLQEAFKKAEKAKGPTAKPPRYVIPARYSDMSKTILRQEVPSKGNVTFALQSQS